MAEKGGFKGDINLPGGSFSKLLLSSSDDVEESSIYVPVLPPLFSSTTPKMLCFGDFKSKNKPKLSANTNITTPINNKRTNWSGSGEESRHESGSGNGQNQKDRLKKNKPEVGPIVTCSPGHAKAKRVKLGERISVLQQLVSPYGKTDTASVLHEAMGYIRFLHEQVKVLCTPYLNCLPSPSSESPCQSLSEIDATNANKKNSREGLRSSGLCLVPVECVIKVGDGNGADFWSSVTISTSRP
ncbi:transcription factor bHLH113-like isoform X2 [Amaranthus tricolor]|uniref:transcription factor bHLH113-like isoform X2 n=1 Tax=Amaranthus tricolor TaxID=29722 RepID=UPI00258B5470|nr:transcription factor bHLH113-like isoform X2 [Amaranthus tricolor]